MAADRDLFLTLYRRRDALLYLAPLAVTLSQPAAAADGSNALLQPSPQPAAASPSLGSPAPPPPAASGLRALLEPNARISNPGVSWALTNASRQLYYPSWLAGEWDVKATFVGVSFPRGQSFISREVPGA